MTRRKPTDSDTGVRPLTEAQLTAIELLIAGRNLTAVAEAVGMPGGGRLHPTNLMAGDRPAVLRSHAANLRRFFRHARATR